MSELGAAGLAGRTVIVTGAARGQGAAEVRSLLDAGAHVVATDVREAAESIDDARLSYVVSDVADETGWEKLVALPPGWPPLGGLVNNAAVHWARPIEEEHRDDVERMWRVNLLGPLLGIKAVTPAMRARGGGSIVNVSSTGGLVGIANQGAYCASKWGLRGLTKVAALELGPVGIRVNSVHPGPIDTPMMRESPTFSATPSDDRRYAHLALGRCGTVDEVSALVLFLLSDASSYTTGAEIAVDGGMIAGTLVRPAVV
jgi:3alpha(or 20beta)-hydroxysteroid dehydrogenase